MRSIAEGANLGATAAAEGHHPPPHFDLVAILIDEGKGAAHQIGPVPIGSDLRWGVGHRLDDLSAPIPAAAEP
jgi:hypothetical protein